MKKITSPDNPKIKHAFQLIASKKYRQKTKEFVLESYYPILETCQNKPELIKYLLVSEFNKELVNIEPDIYQIPDPLLQKITSYKNSIGIIAICKQPEWNLDTKLNEAQSVIILDQINNPLNLGAVIRNAVGFKVEAVFVTDNSTDTFHPTAVRSMAGAIFQMPIFNLNDELAKSLKNKDFQFYGFSPKAKIFMENTVFTKKTALVFGSEAHGIQSVFLKNLIHNKYLKIKISENLESLNLAVASGIATHWLAVNKKLL